MYEILRAILIVDSILIITLILIQARGGGLSIVGGSNDVGKFEMRGTEKTIHFITVGASLLFLLIIIALYLFSA